MTPEAKVKKQVKEILNKYKPDLWYCMPAARVYGRAGTPDFLVCYKGQFIAIETKAGDNKPTALQELAFEQIRKADGFVLVINVSNVSDLILALEGTRIDAEGYKVAE